MPITTTIGVILRGGADACLLAGGSRLGRTAAAGPVRVDVEALPELEQQQAEEPLACLLPVAPRAPHEIPHGVLPVETPLPRACVEQRLLEQRPALHPQPRAERRVEEGALLLVHDPVVDQAAARAPKE